MRVGELLFFAPGLRFDQIELDGPGLPEQLERRITGYYLDPADACCASGHAFAAGVLLVSCIDALARLRYGGGVGERFRRFALEQLASFGDSGLAARFYDEFRNGLVHEARLKRGGQFSLEQHNTFGEIGGVLLINPQSLSGEVRDALSRWVAEVSADTTKRADLAAAIRTDFADDLALAEV